jgi:CheY-like chemotaxis protein
MARGLNNHLTVIGFAGSELIQALPEDSPLRARLDEIRRAAEQAAAMTRKLASYGRPREPRPRLINPSALLDDLLALLRPLLPPRLRLSARVTAPMARLWADPVEMRQTLLNLILESRDAMPGEGEIRVEISTVRLAARGSLRHIGLAPGRYVALAVEDTDGGAVPRARAARMAGLQPVIRKRGGDIWLRTIPGRGTRTSVYLPLAARARRTTRPREAVLLVEADPRVREASAAALEKAGYRVIPVTSSSRAVREAMRRKRRIHLLVADLATVGGTDLIGPVREAHPGVKILFLAGASVPATDLPILEKPFTPESLSAAARDALDACWTPQAPRA